MAAPFIQRQNEISSSEKFVQFTFAAAAIDLSSLAVGAPREGLPCRRIKFNADGALTVTRIDGTNVTLLARKQGEIEDIQAVGVVINGTTAGLLFTVYW